MVTHSHHLWNDRLACPLDSEDLRQLLQVVSRSLTDREDGVTKPSHAQSAELLVEELNSQLACQQRDVLDDGQANAPLLVFGELNDRGEERLREKVDTDDCYALGMGQSQQAESTNLG